MEPDGAASDLSIAAAKAKVLPEPVGAMSSEGRGATAIMATCMGLSVAMPRRADILSVISFSVIYNVGR